MEDLDVRLLVDLLRDRITPNRSLGQHFLLDEAVIERAVEIASENKPINQQSHVLEIGPGPGSLTLKLLRTGARVTAIELDEEAISHLNRVFDSVEGRLQVIHGDALQIEWPQDITHIVSNLPYQISSPILEKIQRFHLNNQLQNCSTCSGRICRKNGHEQGPCKQGATWSLTLARFCYRIRFESPTSFLQSISKSAFSPNKYDSN